MVKCPKCGIKGWENYYPIATLDRDFDGDMMIETNKVECAECKHQFLVRDIYRIEYENSTNIFSNAN